MKPNLNTFGKGTPQPTKEHGDIAKTNINTMKILKSSKDMERCRTPTKTPRSSKTISHQGDGLNDRSFVERQSQLMTEFARLKTDNERLAEENQLLRRKLEQMNQHNDEDEVEGLKAMVKKQATAIEKLYKALETKDEHIERLAKANDSMDKLLPENHPTPARKGNQRYDLLGESLEATNTVYNNQQIMSNKHDKSLSDLSGKISSEWDPNSRRLLTNTARRDQGNKYDHII